MVTAILVAGGAGERFGEQGGKQLAEAGGLPILSHTLRAFDAADTIDHIVIVCHPDRIDEYRRSAVEPVEPVTPIVMVPGGKERQDSVAAGLLALLPECEMVAIHDGARPLIVPDVIDDAVRALAEDDSLAGVVVGHPVYDTLKEVKRGYIRSTPDRSRFWVAQTPQVFRRDVLLDAYAHARSKNLRGTDDASLVEADGGAVRMIEGPRVNIKVTVSDDAEIAEAVLRHREKRAREVSCE